MQETYLSVWRSADSFAGVTGDGGAVGWLWTIAAHRLVDAFRKRGHVGGASRADGSKVVHRPGTGGAEQDWRLVGL